MFKINLNIKNKLKYHIYDIHIIFKIFSALKHKLSVLIKKIKNKKKPNVDNIVFS